MKITFFFIKGSVAGAAAELFKCCDTDSSGFLMATLLLRLVVGRRYSKSNGWT